MNFKWFVIAIFDVRKQQIGSIAEENFEHRGVWQSDHKKEVNLRAFLPRTANASMSQKHEHSIPYE